ncbi:MAG: hypothetical protein HQ557_06095 [Bacteroidetes bacterium]|nr:hypothetical protein [Bacteroidota bacterium]
MVDKIREILAVNIKHYRAAFGYSQMKLGCTTIKLFISETIVRGVSL